MIMGQPWEKPLNFDVPATVRGLWDVFMVKARGKMKEHAVAAILEYISLGEDARTAVFNRRVNEELPKHIRKSQKAAEGSDSNHPAS